MAELPFKPAWWLPNAHFQTLWPSLFRKYHQPLTLKRERIELQDGDFIDLDWVEPEKKAPVVIILHGLEGSIRSHYAQGMLQAVSRAGWRGLFMHFRGCSGEINRYLPSYHSGHTEDLDFVVKEIKKREPHTAFAAVGFSLGGNVLIKWLGETAKANPLTAAVAISVPFELNKAVLRINRGFSRIYERHLLNCLIIKMKRKLDNQKAPVTLPPLDQLRTLLDFDNHITAPLHGFKNAEDYYKQCSSRAFLKKISKPTLLLQAKDDPFMVADLIPSVSELSSFVTLELQDKGGHVGFVEGKSPWAPEYWLEKRVPLFLNQYLRGE